MITEFLIQDRDNNLIGTLIPEDCLTAKRDWQKNGFHTLDLAVPLNHRYAKEMTKGNRIMFKDTDRDKWYEFEIVRENTDADKQAVYCESSYYDTLSSSVPFVDITGNTPINGLRKLLDTAQPKSRWQAGISDIPGSFYMQRTRKNLKETISAWANACGGVISERIEFYNGRIVRYIDILQSVGSDRGRVIYDDREVTQMSVQIPERTNYTMAFGYGKAEMTTETGESKPITFEDVVWSVAKGDPVDKPKGQTWVALPDSYKEQYGILDANGIRQHRCTIWEENGVEIPENLLQRTYDGLLAGLKDNTEYKIKAADFKALGYSTQDIREGDTIGVVLSKLNIKLKAEIIRFTPNYLNPENNDFELSNYSKDIIDDMMNDSELVKNVNDRLDAMIRKVFRQSILDDWNAEIASESGFLIYGDPRDGLVCLNAPTYEQATKATRMKGGSLQIANQKLDGDWKWTTVLTGDGIIADAIFTGIIMGDRMDINLDLSEIRLGDRNPTTGLIEDPVFLFNDDVLRIRIGGTDLEGNLSGIHSSIEALDGQITLSVQNLEKTITKTGQDAAADATTKANQALKDAKNYVTTTITTSEAQIKITTDAITSRVARTEDSITTLNGSATNHETRLQSAEQKITPSAIISTVSDTVNNAVKTANGYTDTKTQNFHSQITQNAKDIQARVTINGLGTAITQNASSVRIAWNNYTQYIQFEYSRLSIYDSASASTKKLVMTLGSNGMRFYRKDDDRPIGQIVTNQLAADSSKKGLDFDLDAGGTFMTWASRNSTSEANYTMKLSFSKENLTNLPAGLSVGCNLDMRGFSINNCNLVKNRGGVNGIKYYKYDPGGTDQQWGYIEIEVVEPGGGATLIGIDAWHSDGRLKRNIQPSSENALSYLEQLPVRSFDWKEDAFHERFGFIAQELEGIDSSLVYKVPQREEDGTIVDEIYQIKVSKFIPVLVKSIQELYEKVENQGKILDKMMLAQGVTYQSAVKALRSFEAPLQQYTEAIQKPMRTSEITEPRPIMFHKNEDGTIEFIEEE
ncbi:phage tail spike protein [Eubacterium sp. 1001713B170207_170306_E7]|uniref:phage tail spike protein n=1 Tax=Eubacterium sp. 1001713B170207_170306_E7 TaxID=2787097 RepID=UPI00189AD560|nr:phage tail spike protein [Eubacterium sp. 1001713B170207_170306_E7]